MTQSFARRLLRWYDHHGRKHLPWQHPITPYRVWVSEIMLQQTQVDTVIPYFERFMARFGDVQTLARAPVDEVLHLWTGLGYYARARNLHKCANALVEAHQGEFPANVDALAALPGIGRSTAAAITSIAFDQPTAILDGNVKRVLARHRALPGWPGKPAVANALWQVADQYMPQQRCRDYTQAIMDLGATLCVRTRPACDRCPVAKDCQARLDDAIAQFPGKKPKKAKPIKSALLLMIRAPNGEILLEQRPQQGIWGGLWSLPEAPLDTDLDTYVQARWGKIAAREPWQGWRHSFSHYHFDIQPVLVTLCRNPRPSRRVAERDNSLWCQPHDLPSIGLAAPVKILLARLTDDQSPQQKALSL